MEKIRDHITGKIIDEIPDQAEQKKSKQQGYFKIFKKRWFDEWKDLTPTQRAIMVSLWLYGAGTCVVWVSQDSLADFLGITKDTVNRNCIILKRKRFFTVEKCKGRGRYFNKYYLKK